jgi:RHS repeat-associated protein
VRQKIHYTKVAGQQFGYDFDDIGNRKTAAGGGSGATSTYSANLLNQYTQRTVPGAVDILGTAQADATVTVNNMPTQRKGEYFYKDLSVPNTVSAQYPEISIVGVRKNAGPDGADVVTEETGHVFVPKTPEVFQHDADGNLTSDGRWTYTWDAENRLIAMETTASAVAAGAPKRKLEFVYDHQWRRVQKKVYSWTGSAWQLLSDLRFLYDGWNLLAEVGTSGSLLRSYTCGLDLSGTEQGAGGIGGVLLITDHQSPVTSHFYAYDGNGNVTSLVDASTGTTSAQYEYDPFGETIRATGPAASSNPFRFSTKYTDSETGLIYYGYRYYQPSTGRWPNRDPLGELGFTLLTRGRQPSRSYSKRWLREQSNLYHFTFNNPINRFDVLGLAVNEWFVVTFPIDKLNCPSTCGPDYTAALNAELAKLKAYIDAAPERPGYYGNIWDLVNYAKLLNWFKNVALALNYDAQAKNAVQGVPLSGCPTVKCLGTITLCGKCVGSDVPGNIMFGYAAASILSDIERDIGAFIAELFDNDGELIEEDGDVFEIGKSLYESGSTDICKTVSKLPSRKNRGDCSPCSTTATFQPASFPGYPQYK